MGTDRFVYDGAVSRTSLGFWGAARCVAALAFLVAGVAHADAVEPPPDECPEGRVPVSDHGGPSCELAPPDDCPPGYRGVVGGECVLWPCETDDACGEGTCREASVCQEYRQLYWDGWDWVGARSGSRPRLGMRAGARDNFLAGPPRQAPDEDPPYAWTPLGVCGQDGPCNPPAECRPLRLCFAKARQAKGKPRKVTMRPTEGRPGGCGKGCTVSRSGLAGAALVFAGLTLVGLVRRRQR